MLYTEQAYSVYGHMHFDCEEVWPARLHPLVVLMVVTSQVAKDHDLCEYNYITVLVRFHSSIFSLRAVAHLLWIQGPGV